MQQDVGMRINQSRHQRQSWEVDHFRIGRCADFANWTNRFDFLTSHEHNPAVVQLCRVAIENVRRLKQINGIRRLRRGLILRGWSHVGKRSSKGQADKKEDGRAHVMIPFETNCYIEL